MVSHHNKLPFWVLTCFLMVFMNSAWARKPVAFSKVEATHHAGTQDALNLTIDGRNASAAGWSIGKKLASPQSAIFTLAKPMYADHIELSMCFMSGRPHSAFADFSVSYTTDTRPSKDGNWQPLPILNYSAINAELSSDSNNHLLAKEVSYVVTGMIPDEVYRISSRLLGKSVTGFRIQVYPVIRAEQSDLGPAMAWAANGDFMLTEFRVEELSSTTNIALGAPVTATHPLHITGQAYSVFVQMLPSALTDGWPSTLAHPKAHGENEGFYFEIDLGQQRILDHIGLRQRGDEYNLNRFGKMRIKVYEQDPKEGATPTWQTLNRPAGTYADQGGVDILREADGEGQFRGRYIRISTESNVKGAPMLAELEVYETRTAQLAGIAMDNQPLLKDTELKIPPEIRRLGLQFEIPQTGKPYDRIYRWRVGSDDKSWQISNTLLLEIPCPPAGDHILEIQAAHSDGSWDASVLKIPITVDARFTQTQAFLWLIVGATLLVGMLSTRYFSRQKIKQLQASSAIETERSRIAMNMHDDVGARLAQLAVLQDVFALEHQLPNAAKTDLSAMTSNIRETMASLNEAVWAVNPRNNTLTALATFLMQYADAYLSPLGITCRVISPNEWQYIKLRAGIRHEVALTFKEALQNIVKHADASEVEVALRQDGKQFIVRVTDNGCGLPEEEAGPGHYGLKNMSRRLNDIGGSCEWLPREPSGTIVEMKLPLT